MLDVDAKSKSLLCLRSLRCTAFDGEISFFGKNMPPIKRKYINKQLRGKFSFAALDISFVPCFLIEPMNTVRVCVCVCVCLMDVLFLLLQATAIVAMTKVTLAQNAQRKMIIDAANATKLDTKLRKKET